MTKKDYKCNCPMHCDCKERVNCKLAGSDGHLQCGWCPKCKCPVFQCGIHWEDRQREYNNKKLESLKKPKKKKTVAKKSTPKLKFGRKNV